TSLAYSPAHADVIPIGNPAPTLAEFASITASRQSRAVATSTLYGTLRERDCTGNTQAWSCRDIVDSQDYLTNRIEQTTATSATASAARDNRAFDTNPVYTPDGTMLSAGAFADYSIATSSARAQ